MIMKLYKSFELVIIFHDNSSFFKMIIAVIITPITQTTDSVSYDNVSFAFFLTDHEQ